MSPTLWAGAQPEPKYEKIVVRGRWGRRSLGVPLAQLKLVGTDKATAQAIADWH